MKSYTFINKWLKEDEVNLSSLNNSYYSLISSILFYCFYSLLIWTCCFQMKVDFRMMENEMESLTSNMKAITAFSEQISSTLQVRLLKMLNVTCSE